MNMDCSRTILTPFSSVKNARLATLLQFDMWLDNANKNFKCLMYLQLQIKILAILFYRVANLLTCLDRWIS